MQLIELIQARKFGDKLNELTGLLYDNYADFLAHTRWYLLAITAIITATVLWAPTSTPVGAYLCLQFVALIITLMVVAFVVLVREVAVQGNPFVFRSFTNRLLEVGKRCLIATLLPLLLLCIAASWLFEGNIDQFSYRLFLTLLGSQLIIVPIMMIISVIVFEEKSGVSAIKRAFALLTEGFFSTLFFYFILCFIGMLVPLIVEIPLIIFNEFTQVSGSDYANIEPESWLETCLKFLFMSLSVCGYLHYLLICALGTLLVYGSSVEKHDNVHFLTKLNNFDNL